MYEVWKFPLPGVKTHSLKMPVGTKLLSLGVQGDVPMMWGLVKIGAPTVKRDVQLTGTGFQIDVVGEFIGTVQMPNGLVWHAFDLGESVPTDAD